MKTWITQTMNKNNILHLIVRYPSLKTYLTNLYVSYRYNDIYDFLIALETDK